MRLSHSKLSTILSCPMTYYLTYIQKITPKVQPPALAIGSAVHWGIEHSTEDLTEYYKENGTFKNRDNYTKDQMLAESMVHGYLKHKDELFKEILTLDGEKLELVDENHEVDMVGELETYRFVNPHFFEGVIDLLLLTNKGFIIIDYKTSSQIPNWDDYIEQIYRYMFMIQQAFPEIPIVKIGIINIRKTQIRQKNSENESQFFQRIRLEYDLNDENYVNYHEYLPESLDQTFFNHYIRNLSKMADAAQNIDEEQNWYINYKNANGQYGKSPYYDIFYYTPGCEELYQIEDHVWDDDSDQFVEVRNCNATDMMVIDHSNVLNKYQQFKDLFEHSQYTNLEKFVQELPKWYYVDCSLISQYIKTYQKEKQLEGGQA